jgi:predicted transcriptional regulator
MNATTIKIHKETKAEIDQFREYKNESYDEVLRKIIYIVKSIKKDPNLSKEAIQAIDAARKRMDKGHFYTEEEAKKILGLA